MGTQDASVAELDDVVDRDELRRRYYGLMQELRVLLPGVQILVAFLLTVPFATRFGNVGRFEKACFGVALGGGAIAIMLFVTPTAIHRLGERRARSRRLLWSIRSHERASAASASRSSRRSCSSPRRCSAPRRPGYVVRRASSS